MGLLDNLKDMVGDQAAADGLGVDPKLIQAAMTLLQKEGGLSGLLAKLEQGGLSDLVQSWLSKGGNLALSGDQVKQALGGDVVGEVAKNLGTDQDEAAGGLAKVLPFLIDKLSPDGQAPDDADVSGALKGLLGSLLG